MMWDETALPILPFWLDGAWWGGQGGTCRTGNGVALGFATFYSLIANHRTLLNAYSNHGRFVSRRMLTCIIPPVSHRNTPRISHRIWNRRGRSHAINFVLSRIEWQVRCRVVKLSECFRGKRAPNRCSMGLNSHWIARRWRRIIWNSFWAAVNSSTDTKVSSLTSTRLAAMQRSVYGSRAIRWRTFTVSSG